LSTSAVAVATISVERPSLRAKAIAAAMSADPMPRRS
jgi:hypothetical protein